MRRKKVEYHWLRGLQKEKVKERDDVEDVRKDKRIIFKHKFKDIGLCDWNYLASNRELWCIVVKAVIKRQFP
jgi:hypothetical protein